MFNFQKEVVLNSLDQVKVFETVLKDNGVKSKKLRIHDGGEYFAKYIVDKKIYKTSPIPGSEFKLTITPDESILGKHIQILIELGLDSDYRGDYGSALYYFRKPMLIDVILPAVATLAADAKPEDKAKALKDAKVKAVDVLHKAFNAVVPKEYKFITMEPTETTEALVIKGADSYQKVRNIVISEFTCEDRCEGSSEELVEIVNYKNNKKSAVVSYEKNNVEFGTYNYVLQNLRLPTYANLRFTSPSAPEMPIKGAQYVQYSFAYCVPRIGFGGMSVVGQTNYSTTMHTFYVLETLSSDFEKDLKELDADFESNEHLVEVNRTDKKIVTILPDTYASSQDLENKTAIAANKKAIDDNTTADDKLKDAVKANRTAIKAAHAAESKSETEAQELPDIE